MRNTAFANWLLWLVLTVVAVAVCVAFVDRPVAHMADPQASYVLALDIVLLFLPLGVLSIVTAGCLTLAGRPLPRWLEVAAIAGFSVAAAITCNFFLLQPGIGRIGVYAWMAHPSQYGFVPFHGHRGSGLPSGHTTIAASYLLVFWIYYRRLRIPIGIVIAAVMVGLVAAGWHFVADVIAGLFTGATAAIMTVALFRARVSPP